MKKAILGKKVGMTQLFNEDGLALPVTVIEAGPCTVIQKKTVEKDGYTALKIGYGDVSEKRLNKPMKSQFSKLKLSPKKYLREVKLDDSEKYEVGQEIKVEDMFQAGDKVDISGVSKGKGFQGTIKRYGQSGGDDTHGSMYHRRVGSMGPNTSPGRVFKGKKLPGHMGVDSITVQNLDIVRVDAERNLLIVKGAVPGAKGSLLVIKDTVKAGK
jgi:large subunit ribosomal protein L3